MHRLLLPFKQSRTLNTLFFANIFIAFHYALIIYINSSMLAKLYTEMQISSLYIIGSILDTILLLNASRILKRLGNYKFTLTVLTFELFSTVGLLLSTSPFLISLCFLVHVFSISLILFNMDVFVESLSKDSETGSIRATYLTITNIAVVIAPLVLSLVVKASDYSTVYLLSSIFLLPLFILVRKFRGIVTHEVKHILIKETLSEYINNKNLFNIFICQTLLQFFYAYMVVYTPLYLSEIVGFSWKEIGLMFTIMLLPFVLFELPLGEMEDDKYGEKEFLTIGFVVMGLSTLFMSFVTAKVFWIWTVMLFISRIGASFVEVSSESYFFKNVSPEKTDVISFFRISRPLSFIVAPIIATILLQFMHFQYVFILIGTIMIFGAHYALALMDTK